MLPADLRQISRVKRFIIFGKVWLKAVLLEISFDAVALEKEQFSCL